MAGSGVAMTVDRGNDGRTRGIATRYGAVIVSADSGPRPEFILSEVEGPGRPRRSSPESGSFSIAQRHWIPAGACPRMLESGAGMTTSPKVTGFRWSCPRMLESGRGNDDSASPGRAERDPAEPSSRARPGIQVEFALQTWAPAGVYPERSRRTGASETSFLRCAQDRPGRAERDPGSSSFSIAQRHWIPLEPAPECLNRGRE